VDELGAVAVGLASDWAAWVNRRVETIEFVEDTTVRRSVSIDFTFPAREMLAVPIAEGAEIFVPLQILQKQTLMHLDVTDEQGASLSVVNSRLNGEVSGRGLVRLFSALMGPPTSATLAESAATRLRGIAALPAAAAHHELEQLLMPGTSLAGFLGIQSKRERPEVRIVRDLAGGFMQLVSLRYEPGRSRVIKVAYDQEQSWHVPDAASRAQRALASVGGWPRLPEFTEISVGSAMSYHVEVVAPPATEIIDGVVRGVRYDGDEDKETAFAEVVRVKSRARAHVHLPLLTGAEMRLPPAVQDERRVLRRNDLASVSVALLVRRGGVMPAASMIAVSTFVLLVLCCFRVSSLDGQTSAAILLLLPAVFSAYLSRPGEHAFTTRALRGVRLAAIASSGLAVVLAAMIGGGFLASSQTGDKPALVAVARGAIEATECVVQSDVIRRGGQELVRPWSVRCPAAASHFSTVVPDPEELREAPKVSVWIVRGLTVVAGIIALWLLSGLLVSTLFRGAARSAD
jgi:hypothetical protein